jgi:hypothetical protein
MEALFRRMLGLYFVITSLGYVPAALAYLGVENAYGPWWILPIVPIADALVFSVAGLLLLRTRPDEAVPQGPGIVFPPLDSLLPLMGLFFIVEGLESAIRPAVDMLFVTEAWVVRVGSFAAAIVWLVGGWILVTRPQAVLGALTRHRLQ